MGEPTCDTIRLVNAAISGLEAIYRAGYCYKKSGVLLMGLQPKDAIQSSLFDDVAEQDKSNKLMSVMDTINRRMGKGSMTTPHLAHNNAGQCVETANHPITRPTGMSCQLPVNINCEMVLPFAIRIMIARNYEY